MHAQCRCAAQLMCSSYRLTERTTPKMITIVALGAQEVKEVRAMISGFEVEAAAEKESFLQTCAALQATTTSVHPHACTMFPHVRTCTCLVCAWPRAGPGMRTHHIHRGTHTHQLPAFNMIMISYHGPEEGWRPSMQSMRTIC